MECYNKRERGPRTQVHESSLRPNDSWQGDHVNPIHFDTWANCGARIASCEEGKKDKSATSNAQLSRSPAPSSSQHHLHHLDNNLRSSDWTSQWGSIYLVFCICSSFKDSMSVVVAHEQSDDWALHTGKTVVLENASDSYKIESRMSRSNYVYSCFNRAWFQLWFLRIRIVVVYNLWYRLDLAILCANEECNTPPLKLGKSGDGGDEYSWENTVLETDVFQFCYRHYLCFMWV